MKHGQVRRYSSLLITLSLFGRRSGAFIGGMGVSVWISLLFGGVNDELTLTIIRGISKTNIALLIHIWTTLRLAVWLEVLKTSFLYGFPSSLFTSSSHTHPQEHQPPRVKTPFLRINPATSQDVLHSQYPTACSAPASCCTSNVPLTATCRPRVYLLACANSPSTEVLHLFCKLAALTSMKVTDVQTRFSPQAT